MSDALAAKHGAEYPWMRQTIGFLNAHASPPCSPPSVPTITFPEWGNGITVTEPVGWTKHNIGTLAVFTPPPDTPMSRSSRVEQAAIRLGTLLQTIKREGGFSDLEELAILAELLNGRAGVLTALAAIKARAMADDEIEKMS